MKLLIKATALFLLVSFAACVKEDLASLEDIIYIRNNKADMPAYIYGNGNSEVFIVVLHGGPGGNGLEYRLGAYAEDLEQKYAMVYWDQRGQGMSQSNGNKNLITIEQLADDLEKLLLVLKDRYGDGNKFVLMGHSWGGTLGSYFMIDNKRQQLVDAWIEVDGAHDIPKLSKDAIDMIVTIGQGEINANRSADKWQDLMDWTSKITLDSLNFYTSSINQKAWEAIGLLQDDGIIEEADFTSLEELRPISIITSTISGLRTGNLLFEEAEKISLTDELYKITKPSLFLWGRYDFVVPPQLGEDAFNNVSSDIKFLYFFEQSGHSPMLNEAGLFVNRVVDFIELLP